MPQTTEFLFCPPALKGRIGSPSNLLCVNGSEAYSWHSSPGSWGSETHRSSLPAGFFSWVNPAQGAILNQLFPSNNEPSQDLVAIFTNFKITSSSCLLHEVQTQERMNIIQIMPYWKKMLSPHLLLSIKLTAYPHLQEGVTCSGHVTGMRWDPCQASRTCPTFSHLLHYTVPVLAEAGHRERVTDSGTSDCHKKVSLRGFTSMRPELSWNTLRLSPSWDILETVSVLKVKLMLWSGGKWLCWLLSQFDRLPKNAENKRQPVGDNNDIVDWFPHVGAQDSCVYYRTAMLFQTSWSKETYADPGYFWGYDKMSEF